MNPIINTEARYETTFKGNRLVVIITDRNYNDPLLHFAAAGGGLLQFTLKGEEIESLGKQIMEIGQHIQKHGLKSKS